MSWLMNGDACVLVEYERPKKFFPYGLRVRLIESDRVSTPHTTGNTVNLYAKDLQTGNRIYNGVELNDAGQIVAYHICSTYPNSNLHAEKEVDACKKPSAIRREFERANDLRNRTPGAIPRRSLFGAGY